jgi:hypothetical protein
MSMLPELILVDTVLYMCHHVHLPLIAFRMYMIIDDTWSLIVSFKYL